MEKPDVFAGDLFQNLEIEGNGFPGNIKIFRIDISRINFRTAICGSEHKGFHASGAINKILVDNLKFFLNVSSMSKCFFRCDFPTEVQPERQLLYVKKAIIDQPREVALIAQWDIIAHIIPWQTISINIAHLDTIAQAAVAANAPMTLCALVGKWTK